MIYESLVKYLRIPASIEGYSTRLSIHEAIKAQLYVLGYRLHLTPVLEANVSGGRIDCLFLRDGKLVCGIEVDYSLKKKSICKLLELGNVERIIISYGKAVACSRAAYRHKQRLGDIKQYLLHYKTNL